MASIVAGTIAAVLAVLWLQTFFPSPPVTSASAGALFLPVIIPLFLVAILAGNRRQRERGPSRAEGIPLTGWRRRAQLVLGLCVLITVAMALAGGHEGTPERQGEQYYLDTGEDVVEVSEDTWRQAQAENLRVFVCIAFVFAAGAALLLAEPEGGPVELPPAPRPPTERADGRLDWRSRLYGYRNVDEHVPLPPDEVLRRLQVAMPTLRSSPVGNTIVGDAEWKERQTAPTTRQSLWVHVDVRIAPAGDGASSVGLHLRMGNRADARRALTGPPISLALVAIAFVAFAYIGAWGTGPFSLILMIWLAIALISAYASATTPSRTVTRVQRRLLAALST